MVLGRMMVIPSAAAAAAAAAVAANALRQLVVLAGRKRVVVVECLETSLTLFPRRTHHPCLVVVVLPPLALSPLSLY